MEPVKGLPTAARRLSAAMRGEVLEVQAILFDLIRQECARVGIREGIRILLREDTPMHLYLDRADGGSAVLRREWGQFIQVEPVASLSG
jgi:hypothetical protein